MLTRFAYRPTAAFVGGVGAAASGMLVLDLTCHVAGAFHPLVFHVAPMVGLAAVLVAARARARTHSFVP